jgi:MFS transporter, FHS family, Na+ dependent glucose transporter 1
MAPRWWASCVAGVRSPRFVGTLAYALSFWLLGVVIASLGPTLLFLSERTGADLDLIGFIFPARSLAYLLGSAFSGPLYDRIPGNRLLSACLFVTTAGTAAIPFCGTVWLLALCVAMQGLAMGFLDTGGNVMLVWLHGGDRVAPYMQLIHFAFGVGAFVSPMIVEASVHVTGTVQWSFVIMAAFFVPVAALVLCTPSPSATDHGSSAGSRRRTRREVRHAPPPHPPSHMLTYARVHVCCAVRAGARGRCSGR